MLDQWVNYIPGVPTVTDFSSTGGLGPPICVDQKAGVAYYLKAGDVVAPLSGTIASVGVEAFGAKGDGVTNDQPAIQAALNYAVSAGVKEVRLLPTHQSWQPAFPGGSPSPINGSHLVITGDVDLVGSPAGTVITLKGPAGVARTKADGVAGWYSGWLIYKGAAVTTSILKNITVNGGLTFTNLRANTESNIYDKGVWMSDALAPNLLTVDHRDSDFNSFGGEIWYMGGVYANASVFVQNLKLRNSPQSTWNPGSLAKIVAVNLESGDTYQPAETISGKGHLYIGGRFYNSGSANFITTESFTANYAYSYPFFTEPYPKWTRFVGTRIEVTQVNLCSRTAGRIITTDCTVAVQNYGRLTDINLTVEAWADQANNFSAVSIGGIATTTTQVPNAPVGVFYEVPQNIHIEVICKRTRAAKAANRKISRGVALSGGLIDRNSVTFDVKGDLTSAGGQPAELVSAPAASSQFPFVDWHDEDGYAIDVAFPTANFSAATGVTHMGINVQANGLFVMTLTNASGYLFAHSQRMRIMNTGAAAYGTRMVKMPATGFGYALKQDRILYGQYDYVDIKWDIASGTWAEDAYHTRQQLEYTNVTTASLPTAAAYYQGFRGFVTDSNATLTAGIGAIVAGGGVNKVPVICDGTNWRIS